MKMIILNLLFVLSVSAWAQSPHLHSLVVYDAKTLQPFGSATQVTNGLNSDRFFYITAAHVYENSNGLITKNFYGQESLKLEKIDSSLDLAILSSPVTAFKSAAVGALTMSFDQALITYPKAYDIQATQGFPKHRLVLEGYDPITQQLKRTEFQGSIAEAYSPGLPGREGMEKILMVNGPARPGYSGGALVEVLPSPIPGQDRPQLRGIVLAVDPFSEKMIVLPAKEIFQSLLSLRSKASVRTEIKVTGGVKYLDSGAVHYRSGIGQFHDSGAGRTTDGGAGRTTDGANFSSSGIFSSGITLPANPQRRWLSIEDFWSEGEPYPRSQRPLLQKTFNGIYQENGQLLATSPDVSLPLLFEQREKQCEFEKAAVSGQKNMNVMVCSWKNKNESVFAIAIPQSTSRWAVYRIRLEKSSATQKPTPIQISAEHWVYSGPSQQLQNLVQNPMPQGSPMQRDGLRTFQSGYTWLHVELSGGYQIRTATQIITGPLTSH